MAQVFALLAFYLLAHFSPTGGVVCPYELPVARNSSELALAPMVVVTAHEVLMGGSVVAELAAQTQWLKDARQQFQDLRAMAGEPGELTEVNVIADSHVPFLALKPVFAAAKAAGLTVSLVTIQ